MLRLYILEGTQPVPIEDLMEWGVWYEKAERRVAFSRHSSGVEVSTAFLGIDHGFMGDVQLFETAVFDDYGCEIVNRYATWDEAYLGHVEIVNQKTIVLKDLLESWKHERVSEKLS